MGSKIHQLPDDLESLIAFLRSPSGYVREAAVRRLARIFTGDELAALIVRLNDWVPQVRDAAREAVLDRLRPDYAWHFIRCLPSILRLSRQLRADHESVLTHIRSLLLAPHSRPLLMEALTFGDRATRRLALAMLSVAADAVDAGIIEVTLASTDPAVRLNGARLGVAHLSGDALEQLLERLLGDRFMPLRREGLYGYVLRLPDRAAERLRASLLDPHAAVQETARFYLAKIAPMDFAAFYRGRIATGLPALLGLGVTGTRNDAAIFVDYLSDPRPRIRRIAIRAIVRLARNEYVEQFWMSLQDPSPGVGKLAAAALRDARPSDMPRRLWSAFETAARAHVRRIVVHVMAQLVWWDRAPLLLRARAWADRAGDDELRARIELLLDHGVQDPGRYIARPSAEQLLRVAEAFEPYVDAPWPPVRWIVDVQTGVEQWLGR